MEVLDIDFDMFDRSNNHINLDNFFDNELVEFSNEPSYNLPGMYMF